MNASDIRIIKPVGTVAETLTGMQLELNVVSIDGGEIMYDLREWSLDHDKVGQGISFDTAAAEVLLAYLKECFKDGGESINLNTISIPAISEARQPTQKSESRDIDMAVVELLKEAGLSYTDKREKGGALWVVGGHEIDDEMSLLAEKGYKFFFSEKGGKQTKGQPGWYIRAKK